MFPRGQSGPSRPASITVPSHRSPGPSPPTIRVPTAGRRGAVNFAKAGARRTDRDAALVDQSGVFQKQVGPSSRKKPSSRTPTTSFHPDVEARPRGGFPCQLHPPSGPPHPTGSRTTHRTTGPCPRGTSTLGVVVAPLREISDDPREVASVVADELGERDAEVEFVPPTMSTRQFDVHPVARPLAGL